MTSAIGANDTDGNVNHGSYATITMNFRKTNSDKKPIKILGVKVFYTFNTP